MSVENKDNKYILLNKLYQIIRLSSFNFFYFVLQEILQIYFDEKL